MSSGSTSQDKSWKAKEQGEEAKYIHEKEQAQLTAIRDQMKKSEDESQAAAARTDRDFEGGYGGQEDLEDRYATTSGEH